MHTSHVAVVEFLDALGIWEEDSLLKHLRQASYLSIVADECTDVYTIEECGRAALFRNRASEESRCGEHI